MNSNRLGKALALLKSLEFIPINNSTKIRKFSGVLKCKKGDVKITLSVKDWDFITYPIIIINERPSFFPKLMPHLMDGNQLCYFSSGVVLDRYLPDVAISQCLNQAKQLIDEITSNEHLALSDFQDEFLNYWAFGQKKEPWPVIFGEVESDAESADYYLLEEKDNKYYMVSQSAGEVRNFADAVGFEISKKFTCKCWIFSSQLNPVVTDDGLPRNVKSLFKWLSQWDKAVYSEIQAILERNKEYLKYGLITFAIKTPRGILGFGFDIDLNHRQYKRKPNLYKQYLHNKGEAVPIFRMYISEIGYTYIHSRNLLSPNLINKRITLVGCGSIGGYLAQGLVRLGAGTGEHGKLTLIDPGTIEADNLGRHYLGFPNLFKSKAEALKEELTSQFPYASILASCEMVKSNKQLFTTDFLIDATGEETLSEMLNEHSLPYRDKGLPVLYVWIKGNGECVQALLVDSPKFGCYRCLLEPNGKNYRKERFNVLIDPPKIGYKGCASFTPYAVSAPMHASSLAIDLIIDFMKGDPSPRFRTRYVENSNTKIIKNQNIAPIKGCPACSEK